MIWSGMRCSEVVNRIKTLTYLCISSEMVLIILADDTHNM